MDDSRHAPMMKQCMQCHHWALLTKENWPRSSRDDPSKSCCRKCRAKGLPVEAGDSDEDISVGQSAHKTSDQDRSIMASRWAFAGEVTKTDSKGNESRRKTKKEAKLPVEKTLETKQYDKSFQSRDKPPHLDASASKLEARQFMRSSLPESLKSGPSRLSENNQKLLEMIEKMEKRNRDRIAMQNISNSYMQDPRHAWQ